MTEIKVKLSKPILEIDDKQITELTFREPEFGDLLDCPDSDNEMVVLSTIIQKCANLSLPAVKKISLKDIKQIGAALEPFLDL